MCKCFGQTMSCSDTDSTTKNIFIYTLEFYSDFNSLDPFEFAGQAIFEPNVLRNHILYL